MLSETYQKSPYELFTGLRPNLSKINVFGTKCYSYIDNPKKLDGRDKEGIFVGYDKGIPAYLVYDPTTRNIIRARNVVFDDANKPDNTHPVGDSYDDEDNCIIGHPKHEREQIVETRPQR